MSIRNLIRGYIAVIFSAILYGCMPMMAKYIYADGVTPLTLVFLRNFLASPFIAALAYAQNKTLRIPLKMLPRVSLTALFGSCITPILLFTSYQFIDSGTATVFHFIYPAIVVLGGVLLKEEQLKWGNVISVALCFVGICLFYNPNSTLDWHGAIPAMASGITYAAYILLLSHSDAKKIPSFLFAFYVSLTCTVVTLILCLVTGQLALPQTLTGWGLSALFAVGITCGAVVLFQLGTYFIGGQQAAIISALEPITGVVVGALVFKEVLGFRTVLGSVFVILATILIGVYNYKKAKRRM